MIIARKCSKLIYIYVYRQCCLVHFAANCSNWKITIRKPVATTWKMNENQFHQMFLNPWHMLSYIWVHLGLWRPIFTAKIWFSHIFPASARSPFLSVILTDKLARLEERGWGGKEVGGQGCWSLFSLVKRLKQRCGRVTRELVTPIIPIMAWLQNFSKHAHDK